MKPRHPINSKAYIRAVVAISLLVSWGSAALTGFLLWVAPTGPRAGRVLVSGLTRHEWGNVHFALSVVALCVTAIHLVVDWRVLTGVLRYLISVHRHASLLE